MPKSFQEIDRAKALQAQQGRTLGPSREEIVAEQDARNEEATAELVAQYEEVFGTDEQVVLGSAGGVGVVTETGESEEGGEKTRGPKAGTRGAAAKQAAFERNAARKGARGE